MQVAHTDPLMFSWVVFWTGDEGLQQHFQKKQYYDAQFDLSD